MPFSEIYAVCFRNGNLHPHWNLPNWPDMAWAASTDYDMAEQIPDAAGTTIRITRDAGVPALTAAVGGALVAPPGGIPLDTRLLLRTTFDLPLAEGFDDDGQLQPVRPRTLSPEVHGPPATTVDLSGESLPGPELLTIPEPWAVVLSVGLTPDLHGDDLVNVTCQFHHLLSGVRLNTIADAGVLQRDQATCLEQPLDYRKYQGGYVALPGGTDGEAEPPVFTLEHSFCGWQAATNGHTPGCGFLRISRTWLAAVQDHRVFSDSIIAAASPAPSSLGMLGVSLATMSGVGRLSVRLRTFSVWMNT